MAGVARRAASATDTVPELQAQLATSAMVLRVHQDKTYPGAMIASLSIPWGDAHDDIGGYHLVCPGLVESAGGLLALVRSTLPRISLRHLIATQLAEGNWSRTMAGRHRILAWQPIGRDGFPVLLCAALAKGCTGRHRNSGLIRRH